MKMDPAFKIKTFMPKGDSWMQLVIWNLSYKYISISADTVTELYASYDQNAI